jgi:PEGA domain
MKMRYIVAVTVLAAAAAAAQQPAAPDNTRGQVRAQKKAQPPKAVTHNGHPALEFDGPAGSGVAVYIEYFMRQGEPALGFAANQEQCRGHVYVTRTRITGDFHGTSCESFDVPREGATAERDGGKVIVTAGNTHFTLAPLVERGDEAHAAPLAQIAGEMLTRAVKNFGGVHANVRRMALEAQGQATGPAVQPAPVESPKQQPPRERRVAPGMFNIASDPGDAQVYLNDQPRGMTSEEGRETVSVAPGTYHVRVSLPGYKDFEQEITLASGKSAEITAKLEPVGPPPLTASDMAEMLQGKMSPKRIQALVQERGVDFALNPDLEKRLRAVGATSDLLLAIATNKKK